MNNFKIILETMIDNSSLSNVQKQLAKERLKINADISVEDFAKSKQAIEKQIANLAKGIKGVLGDAVSDKQASQWAKQYYDTMISGIKQAAKEQEKFNSKVKEGKALAQKQANDKFTTQQSTLYKGIIKNQNAIYSLKKRLLSADKLETDEINKQISSLEKKNKYNKYKLSKNGMTDPSLENAVKESQATLETQYKLAETRKQDNINAKKSTKIVKEQTQAEKEKLELLEKQRIATANTAKENAKATTQQEITQQKEINSILSKQQSAYKEIWNVNKQIASLDPNKDSNQISALNEKKKVYQDIYLSAQKELQNYNNLTVSQEHLNSLAVIRKKAQADINVLIEKQNTLIAQQQANKVNDIKVSIGEDGNTTTKIKLLRDNFTKLGLSAKDVEIKMKSVDDTLKKLQKEIATGNDKAIISQFDNLNAVLSKTQNELKATRSEYSFLVSAQRRLSKANEIEIWNKKNPDAGSDILNTNQAYINSLRDLNEQMDKMQFNEISEGYKLTKSSYQGINKLSYSLKNQFTQVVQSIGQMVSLSSIIAGAVYKLKEIPKAVYEVDTAMTNLYKVTDETQSKYNQFLTSASSNAQELGRSVSSLVEQSANWAKLGFDIDQSAELAKTSSIYANVGEVDDETAVSDIITAMKAFNIEAENSINIVDKLNKLGNEFATSSADLGEGLSNSASAMALGGNSLEKTLALLTGGAEITQEAGELGNALKVGQMRVRGMSGELEQLGEEVDENVESISKMQTHILNLTSGKINIFDSNNNFKDYYDILEEVSNIYDKLSSTEQADLLETLFGKQRGNQGAAIIQAFQSGQIQKALEAASNAEGSAMQEQERWMQSLEAKTKQFEASFQSLSNTVLSSDLLKSIVDLGTGTLNILDGIVSKFNEINSFFTGDSSSLFGTIGLTYLNQKNSGGLIRLIIQINNSPFLATVEFNSNVYEFCI